MHAHIRACAKRVAERIAQTLVDLDHVYVRDALCEVLGEHPEAAADLEHHIVLAELGRAGDHPEDVGIDEEVLAEVAVGANAEAAQASEAGLRRHASHHANVRAALAVIAAASSALSVPRSCARNASV